MEQTTPPTSTPQPSPEVQQQPPPPSSSPPPPAITNVSSTALPPPTTSSVPLPPASTSPQPSLPPPTQNPHHATSTPQSQTTPQVRTAALGRPWQQQLQQQQPSTPSHFSHYPLSAVPLPAHSSSCTANSSSSSLPLLPPSQRGGMAIGVPASVHHPGASPPTPPSSFPSHNPPSFGQPFGGGMGRNVPDSVPTSNSPQLRPMMGAIGSSPAVRPPTGGPAHQLRPVQSAPRPLPNSNIQTSGIQSFQGHGMLRVSAVGSPGTPLPGSSQSSQPQNQPWLNASSQVRPPLPSASLRPQVSPQSMQQRSHIPPQNHNGMSTASQQHQVSPASQAQQPSTSGPHEHHGQQLQQSRIQQSLPIQQQITRSPSLGTQRSPQTTIPSASVQSSLPARAAIAEPEGPCNRILRKRTIQELVTQVDPSEKLAPEVEDILVDIADDFVESITSFGCSLAKHRKSTTLEAKDILLHLERNWNVTLPGFSGDEIKMYRKPFTSDIHRERLAMIKKSILAGETLNSKSLAGQAGGNPKGHVAKGPNSLLGSPPTKVREVP